MLARLERIETKRQFNRILKEIYRNEDICVAGLFSGGNGSVMILDKIIPLQNIALKVNSFRGHGTINISRDLVVEFQNMLIGEYIIGMVLNDIFSITPHVMLTYSYSACEEEVMVMENLSNRYPDGNVSNLEGLELLLKNERIRLTERLIDGIYISFMHTLFVLQNIVEFQHRDISFRNIFIKKFTSEEYFQGLDMTKITYFEYRLKDGESLYVKNPGFCIKLGDFGLSTIKVGNTLLLNSMSFEEFSSLKDYVFFTREFVGIFGYKSSLLQSLLLNVSEFMNLSYLETYQGYIGRFSFEDREFNSSLDILKMSMFDKYRVRPERGNICTINFEREYIHEFGNDSNSS